MKTSGQTLPTKIFRLTAGLIIGALGAFVSAGGSSMLIQYLTHGAPHERLGWRGLFVVYGELGLMFLAVPMLIVLSISLQRAVPYYKHARFCGLTGILLGLCCTLAISMQSVIAPIPVHHLIGLIAITAIIIAWCASCKAIQETIFDDDSCTLRLSV